MNGIAKVTCTVALFALLVCPLAACSNSKAANSAEAAEATQLDEGMRAEIVSMIAKAREHSFTNVTFSMKTETTASMRDEKNNLQQQIITTDMTGQLDQSGETPVMHMGYEGTSSTKLEKTTYDMYIDKTGIVVSQQGQLFKNPIDDATLQGYASSITAIGAEDELNQLLDVASSYDLQKQDNGDTLITIVADVNKLAETTLVDMSSLPEGSSVATLVASYVIDPENHFKTVRLMSSTTGTPTYRVDQNYQFSNYDTTVMPEWPDLEAYYAEQVGIKTDEQGRRYMVADDGQIYYVESIDENGMIHFQMPEGAASSESGGGYSYSTGGGEGSVNDLYDYVILDPSAADGGSAQNTTATSGSSAGTNANTGSNAGGANTNTSTQQQTGDPRGRASINVEGTQYWLDTDGAVKTNSSGDQWFYPNDGTGPYLLDDPGA